MTVLDGPTKVRRIRRLVASTTTAESGTSLMQTAWVVVGFSKAVGETLFMGRSPLLAKAPEAGEVRDGS